MQMALDEACLDAVAAGARPTLRFWDWIEPALVLGSHQSLSNEVDTGAAADLGFTIARRMSGGGTMIAEPGGTVTYSMCLPVEPVAHLSFVDSFAALDAWAVDALRGLGVPAAYRPINDIVSPRGKIAGAAQARRRGAILHHTTMAHSMDPALVRRLIRIGRPRLSERGLRSAEKEVSPLAWFTERTAAGVVADLAAGFAGSHRTRPARIADRTRQAAARLVESKYATRDWIERLP